MKYITPNEQIQHHEAWIIPMYEEDALPTLFTSAFEYDFSSQIKREKGALTTIYTFGKMPAATLCFVGLGKKEEMTYANAKKCFGTAFYAQKEDCCFYLDSAFCDSIDDRTIAKAAGYASVYSTYRMQKINKEEEDDIEVTFLCDPSLQKDIETGCLIAQCINHARDLGNCPSNYLTPDAFVQEALQLSNELDLDIEILDTMDLEELGAGAIVGVNNGSNNEAYLITLTYRGDPDAPMNALVGKGITFDSGGYCLKPRTSMTGMKYDMCGAANALCTLEYAARSNAKVNLMAVLAVTENKIGADGFTPDDVLISLSGKTIELTNTDAEGRLILCDAITHACNHQAKRIIDLATLTGACVTALGSRYTGAFTNDQTFLHSLSQAAATTGELMWQLPIDEEFHKEIRNSTVADLINSVPNGKGGSCLAAAFLEEFVPADIPWIHLDIAGPAETSQSKGTAQKGATGVMIETLIELLCSE